MKDKIKQRLQQLVLTFISKKFLLVFVPGTIAFFLGYLDGTQWLTLTGIVLATATASKFTQPPTGGTV